MSGECKECSRDSYELVCWSCKELKKLRQQIIDANEVISTSKDMTNNGDGFSMIDVYYDKYKII